MDLLLGDVEGFKLPALLYQSWISFMCIHKFSKLWELLYFKKATKFVRFFRCCTMFLKQWNINVKKLNLSRNYFNGDIFDWNIFSLYFQYFWFNIFSNTMLIYFIIDYSWKPKMELFETNSWSLKAVDFGRK